MNAASFRSIFATLHNLDLWTLEEAGVITPSASGGSDWTRFNRDLTTFVLKLPADRLEKLVGLIESRQPKTVPEQNGFGAEFLFLDCEDRAGECA